MFNFKVMPDQGDEYEVVATSRDVKMWEKTTKGASFARLQETMRMADLYRIAYNASTRQGFYDGTFAEFEENCDIDLPEDSGEADPFPEEA